MRRPAPQPTRSQAQARPREPAPTASAPRTAGYKLGNPYRVGNVWYVPREEPNYDRTGTGSWYGADFHGRTTANGERYDMNALTGAHPTLPLPSYVTVTNLSNGRTVLVRVNDRGPYVGGRMIDLSRAAARALGYEHLGTAQLQVRYAGRAPLNGDTTREREFLAAQPWNGAVAALAPPSAVSVQAKVETRPINEPSSGWSTTEYRLSLAAASPVRPQGTTMPWSLPWGLGSGDN